MKSAYSKILVLIVGVFYLIAALEIDIKDTKQTWGDEYDTYVISVNDHHSIDAKQVKDTNYITPIIFCTISSFECSEKKEFFFSNQIPISNDHLYLRYSALLI